MNMDIITPSSNNRPYSAMGGQYCTVWFDRTPNFIRNGLDDSEDVPGTNASLEQILAKVSDLESSYDHIIVGGFSMGGGLSLHLLREDGPANLRAIFSAGSYLVQSSLVNTVTELGRASSVPVLMMHGEDDPMIQLDWGRKTAANLLLRKIDVQFRTYPHVQHELATDQLAELLHWIKDVLRVYMADATAKRSSDSMCADAKVSSDPLYPVPEDSKVSMTTSTTRSTTNSTSRGDEAKGITGSSSGTFADTKASSACNGSSSTSSRSASNRGNERKSVASRGMDEKDGENEAAAATASTLAKAVDRMQMEETTTRVNRAGDPDPHMNKSTEDIARSGRDNEGMLIPFTIEYVDAGGGGGGGRGTTGKTGTIPRIRVKYTVPAQLVHILIARPVLACGSMFEILEDPPDGIQVLMRSSDPHKTAIEIGKRLQVRISSGGASLNACPMS
eukprot:CAMPEP_0175004078 /NCGR_PEP_ID=MMETSP0005-20121125/4568_1 /TAXON_ID=420556 /ORGANISM="Ochromonas sp., Strain CCMP1393" /LENGTH=446 /DNA_ID=CAMNT_0016259193 /DNA_START=160 /DNA_END=1500 /DNA_ORIENTATION=+